jgi:hypothetical protein
MNHVKCLKCRGDLYFTDNICVGVLYAIKCDVCGRDHYFTLRVPGKRFTPISFERLGAPVPLEVNVSNTTNHRDPNYKGKLKSTYSFRKEDQPEISMDDKIVILYEMFADKVIDEDQFNRFLMRLMING